MYIVGYTIGEYSDYRVINVFVTEDHELAEKWFEKFKRVMAAYDKFYDKLSYDFNKFINTPEYQNDDSEEYTILEQLYYKYSEHFLSDVNTPFIKEINKR